MDLIAWFDHRIASCEQRATQVDDELKFVYLDAARENREARDAVVELIAIATRITFSNKPSRAGDTPHAAVPMADLYALDAALSRIGGEA